MGSGEGDANDDAVKDASDDAAKKHGALRIGCGRGTLLTDSDEWWQPLGGDELAIWYGE